MNNARPITASFLVGLILLVTTAKASDPARSSERVIVATYVKPGRGVVQCEQVTHFELLEGLARKGEKRQYKGAFVGCEAARLPYGTYVVRARSFLGDVSGVCRVYTPRPVCMLEFDAYGDLIQPATITILFERQEVSPDTWVALSGIFSTEPSVASFDSSGTAHIAQASAPAIATIIRGGQPIASALLDNCTGQRYELHYDQTTRGLFATCVDASRKMPATDR